MLGIQAFQLCDSAKNGQQGTKNENEWNRRWNLTKVQKLNSKQQINMDFFFFFKKCVRNSFNLKFSLTLFLLLEFVENWLLDLADCLKSLFTFLGALLSTVSSPPCWVSEAALNSLLPLRSPTCGEINIQDLVLMEIALELGKNGKEKCLYLFSSRCVSLMRDWSFDSCRCSLACVNTMCAFMSISDLCMF